MAFAFIWGHTIAVCTAVFTCGHAFIIGAFLVSRMTSALVRRSTEAVIAAASAYRKTQVLCYI